MAAVRGAAAASAATAGDIILITYIIYSFVWPSHIIVRNIRQIISPARSWVAGALGRLTQFARNVFLFAFGGDKNIRAHIPMDMGKLSRQLRKITHR